MIRIKIYWEKLSATIWFIPITISAVLAILAFGLVSLDMKIDSYAWSWLTMLQIGSSGVRQVLAVTTGAMMSITGVVFSISVVALSLAASQFGPKILRNYLRDIKNKLVLGLLVGSFLFGLVVLASISDESSRNVPIIAFTVSLLLVLMALVGLIYFIHNISTTIQADQIIALIGKELNEAIDRSLTEIKIKEDSFILAQKWKIGVDARSVKVMCAKTSGYVGYVDINKIIKFLEENDIYLEILIRPGDFIIENTPIMNVYYFDLFKDSDQKNFYQCVSFGRHRTAIDDLEFAVMQLMQIALRALSPGTNDSLTAISCIDWLSASLASMARKEFSIAYLKVAGTVRLKKRGFDFSGVANAVFNPLRQNTRTNELVMIRLLESITQILIVCGKQSYADILFHHAELIILAARENFKRGADQEDIEKRFEKCEEVYKQGRWGSH